MAPFIGEFTKPDQDQAIAGTNPGPVPQTPEQSQQEGDLGVLDYAADMMFSGGSGVMAAVQETADLGHSAFNYVDNKLGTDFVPEENPIYIPGSEYDPETMAGDVSKGITQFLTGFIGAGKVLKPIQWASRLRKAGKFGQFMHGTAQGAMADFAVFDPQEGRFADVLKNAGIQNDVIDYLAHDDDPEGELEGRLKNTLEGAALGAITEPLFMAFRGLKGAAKAKKAGDDELAAKILADETDQMEEILGKIDDSTPVEPEKGPFNPKEKVEVYSESERKIVLKEADENGKVTLDKGQRFVVSHAPSTPKKPTLIDYDKFKKIASRSTSPEELEKADLSDVFNYEHMEAPEDVLSVLDNLAQEARKGWDDGVESHQTVAHRAAEMADMMGQNSEFATTMRLRLQKDAASFEEMTSRFILYKKWMQGQTDAIAKLSKKVARDSENVTKTDEANLLRMMGLWEETMTAVKKVQKGAARVTAAGNINTKPTYGMDVKELIEAIDKAGGSKKVRKVALQLAGAGDDPKAMAKMVNKLTKSKKFDIHNEFWINSILSGPKTHMVNMLSNAAQTTLLPMERIVGGAVTGNLGAMKEGMRLYSGLMRYTFDALKWAGKSAMYEQSFIDTLGHGTYDAPTHVISAKNLGYKDNTTLGFATNVLGKAFRMPSRLLGAEDEFFKQLNYRAKVHADLTAKAIDAGKTGKEIGEFVSENFEKFTTHKGASRYKPALEYAREVTFTQDLEYGLSKWMQDGSRHFPGMRIIAPFIRTPANIVRNVWKRTPIIGKYQRQLAAELASEDPVVRASARGKQTTGALLWTSAIMLAANGRVTGGGPQDPRLRTRLLETGWQPYSVVTENPDGTKTYTQISRLDPFAMFFGVAADYVEISQHVGDDEASEIAMSMMAALLSNVGSKTYLRGVIDAVNVFSNPERYIERWVQQRAASYVPFASLAGETRRNEDPAMREVRSIVDAVRNKIPGLSETLPAKHSWVTGEPVMYPQTDSVYVPDMVNPFVKKTQKEDMVLDELLRLQHGFTPPPRKISQNVELNSEQYSELMRLHGKVRLGGRTMYQALERAMKTSYYDIERKRRPDVPGDMEGPRLKQIRRIISLYRKAAKRELLKADPKLNVAYRQDKMNKQLAKGGRFEQLVEITQ